MLSAPYDLNDEASDVCQALAAGKARTPFMSFALGGGGGGGGGGAKKGGGACPASLPRLLDLSLLMSERGICDAGAVFTLLEHLTETCTIADSQQVFTWVGRCTFTPP